MELKQNFSQHRLSNIIISGLSYLKTKTILFHLVFTVYVVNVVSVKKKKKMLKNSLRKVTSLQRR